jgi:hypothetical protein
MPLEVRPFRVHKRVEPGWIEKFGDLSGGVHDGLLVRRKSRRQGSVLNKYAIYIMSHTSGIGKIVFRALLLHTPCEDHYGPSRAIATTCARIGKAKTCLAKKD